MEQALSSTNRRHSERRAAARAPQSGALKIYFTDPLRVSVSASLIETSATGFRASHNSNAVAPGMEVDFQSEWRSGTARVIWTSVQEGRCVSGFLIL
jgi:hypothetical protein